jgi:predicted GTPase
MLQDKSLKLDTNSNLVWSTSSTTLEEETNASIGTTQIKPYSFVYANQYRIHLIDTPGFNDSKRRDVDVLQDLTFWLFNTYQDGIKLHGLIFMHQITDNRMYGTSHKYLAFFKELCGQRCFPRVVLVTTMLDKVKENEKTEKQRELQKEEYWGDMLRQGSKMRENGNTHESAIAILKEIIEENDDITLAIQEEMLTGARLEDTGAGRVLFAELTQEQENYKRDLQYMTRSMAKAIQTQDIPLQKNIEAQKQQAEAGIQATNQDLEALSRRAEDIINRQDQRMREMQIHIENLEDKLNQIDAGPQGVLSPTDQARIVDATIEEYNELTREHLGPATPTAEFRRRIDRHKGGLVRRYGF